MRKILLFIGLLTPILSYSNPIQEPPPLTISEIYFESETKWKIELVNNDGYYDLNELIDSVIIKNKTGLCKIPFKLSSSIYIVISNDSLNYPFIFDLNDDYLKLCTYHHISTRNDYDEDSISWGDGYGSYLPNIKYGQSIEQEGTYFYKDNSPTIGFQNDLIDATGTIYGYWYDEQYNKVLNKNLYTRYGHITTDDNGFYKIHLPSRKYYIDYGYLEYHSGPESYYSGDLQITPIHFNLEVNDSIQIDFLNKTDPVPEYVKPGKIILTNYPNPADQITNFVFDIPEQVELKSTSLIIADETGKLFYNLPLTEHSGALQFNCSGLANGIYSFFILQNNLSLSKTGTLIVMH
jgi:hypothetical protein